MLFPSYFSHNPRLVQLIKQNSFFILLCIFLIAYFIAGVIGMDPDFGWHIRVGQYILQHGIPLHDPFSYTMPQYQYIENEWLTSILLTKAYNLVGRSGLALFFSFITLTSLLMATRIQKNKLLLVIGAVCLLAFTGIRMQVISWLLFVMLIFLLSSSQQRIKLLLPLLFLLWANLHGSFPLGISIVTISTMIDLSHKKLSISTALIIICSCLLATLINPYGLRIWVEPIKLSLDSSLRWRITEWLPLPSMANAAVAIFMALTVYFIVKYRVLFTLKEQIIVSLLLGMSITSIRHFPFFLLYSLPLFMKAVSAFQTEAAKIKYGEQRFKIAYQVLIWILMPVLILQAYFNIKSAIALSEKNYYPAKAVNFLKIHSPQGNLFAPYNWGGYLLLALPNKKTYIDGRMPGWKTATATTTESKDAINDYQQLLLGKLALDKEIRKYKITAFLLPTQDKSFSLVTKQLHQLSWKPVYSDSIAVIYLSP